MADVHRTYIPASGKDWALPLYDPLVKLLGGDAARRLLVEQAALQEGQRVLEIGCGTGSLLMAVKKQHPRVEVVGLDPDAKALERATRKAKAASLSIALDQGFSDTLPYPDASFDRVFSCFMFHHLQDKGEKQRTLREVRRVLKRGGSLHLLDFAPAQSHESGFLMRWLHPHKLEENSDDRVLRLMRDAGLADPTALLYRTMLVVFRTTYYRALA